MISECVNMGSRRRGLEIADGQDTPEFEENSLSLDSDVVYMAGLMSSENLSVL